MTQPKGRARRLPLILEAIGYGLLGLWLIAWAIVWIAGEMDDAGWWASDAGRTVSGLAFIAALAGIPVVLVGAIVVVLYRSARSVLITAGTVVAEPDPPPPLEPATRCPAWRVTLPDGPHTVNLDGASSLPQRLECDGQRVDLTWPSKWRGSPEAVFTISGHQARLVQRPDWRKTLQGGGLPTVYRHDLRVEGASVEPLDAEAKAP